jgi:hypothetical protein
LNNLRIERIEGVETANFLGTAHVHGESQPHAPGPERLRNARQLGEVRCNEQVRVGIDIVHRTAVDANRGQQAGVVAGAREVVNHAAVLPENGPPPIPTLDGAVEVIPLVDPA